jgi:hypothetical protein
VERGAKTQDDDVRSRHVTLVGDIPASSGRHAISQGVCSNILKGILQKNGHETHLTFFFACVKKEEQYYTTLNVDFYM